MPNILVGEPEPGHTVPREGGGEASWSWNMSGLQPMLGALMGRWGDVMDIQTERLREQARNDPIAFHEWLQKREDDRKQRYWEMQREADQTTYNRQQQAAAEQAARDAAYGAEQEKRIALNAGIDRARSLQSQYGGPTPFSPAGAVADFYEYGAGNPQGRGGGGSTGQASDVAGNAQANAASNSWQVKNCLNSGGNGPGCQGTLQAAGYAQNPTTGAWEAQR